MKKYFRFTLLALAATMLFTACSNEEELTDNAGKTDPAGTIGFSFPMNKGGVTYAGTPEDGTVAIANPNESVIRGVRIYMFNTTDGKLADWQAFSEQDLANNSGKALFNVTGKSGAYTFYALANAEFHVPTTGANSLGDLIKGTSTLADFQKIISNNTGKTLLEATSQKGLLLVGYRDVADILNPSGTEKVINLKRRVARFDIQNLETDGTPENLTGTNFHITAIYVTKANYAGYLTAEASIGATIPTGNIDPIAYTGTNDGVLNPSVFYLWPTELDIAHSKTVISIEGTLNGVKQIYLVKPTINTEIKGNYRYILTAKREAVNKIGFTIKADIWNEGEEVAAEINQTATTFGALTHDTPAGGTFLNTVDGTTVNLDASAATGTTVLKYTTTSWRSGATEYTMNAYNGTANGGTDITVTKSENVTYAGAQYLTTYTITVPKQTVPVDRKVVIADVTDPNNIKEIIIKANPNYDNTALKPVLVGGIYWAPVNVGASTVDATTMNQASMGLLFQWGRNTGSVYGATTDIVAGPMALTAANAIPTKFITNAAFPKNWLDNSSSQAEKDALWSAANAQTPCPAGWRLPTDAESKSLTTKYNASGNLTVVANRYSIEGDVAGKTLYFPATGYRNSDNGLSAFNGTHGLYWTSSFNGSEVYFLNFGPSIEADIFLTGRAGGLSVRCVQK